MNVLRSCGIMSALLALACAAATAGIPSGTGGFTWRTRTPQANDLRAVCAPSSPSNGAGLLAAGDASTLLFRRTPVDSDEDAWSCRRQALPRPDEHFLGVDATYERDLVAVCTSFGRVFVGDGCLMTPIKTPMEGALRSISLARHPKSGLTISTVGDGAALVSVDGGQSFQVVQLPDLPSPVVLRSVHFPKRDGVPGEVGYAAGEAGKQGVLLRSDDGGVTWRDIRTIEGGERFLDVYFLDDLRGFVLGDVRGRRVLQITETGGETWRTAGVLDSGVETVAAFDTKTLLLGGTGGLFFSETGGETFQPAPEPVEGLVRPIPIRNLDIVPKSGEAWAVGDRGVIFFTQDGGRTWRTPWKAPLHSAHLQTIYATRYLSYPEGEILAVGAEGAVLRSRNGGRTYDPVPNPLSTNLLALAAPGGRNAGTGGSPADSAVLVGSHQSILTYEKDGTIRPRSGIPNVDLHDVSVLTLEGSERTWAVGDSGVVLYRTDKNPSWTLLSTPTQASLRAIRVIATGASSVSGWIVGAGGTILRSTDGETWTATTPLPDPHISTNLNDVAVLDEKRILVVGDSGLIALSEDGGQGWSVLANPDKTLAHLYGAAWVMSANGPIGYAVGERQVVLKGVEGGRRWIQMPRPLPNAPDFTLRSVHFVTAEDGIAVGDGGHVLRTTTGGAEAPWIEMGTPGTASLRAVHFGPLNRGAVVGTDGSGHGVFLTAPKWGEAFTGVSLPPETGPLNGVAVSPTSIVAVGDAGAIVRLAETGGPPAAETETGAFRAVVSPVDGVYVAAGDGGVFLISVDHGATWKEALVKNPYGSSLRINAIGFAEPGFAGQTGYAGGTAADGTLTVLLRTLDGGNSWEPVEIPFAQDGGGIQALAVVSEALILAAGGQGAVFIGRGGGLEWTAVRPDPAFTGQWKALRASEDRWYVVGEGGRAGRYPGVDDPRSWQMLNTGTDNALLTITGPTNPPLRTGYDGGGDALHDDICNLGGEKGTLMDTALGGMALFADVNRDASINLVDAAAVLRGAAGLLHPSLETWYYGDIIPSGPTDAYVPGDGLLNVLDAAAILRMSYGL